MVASHVPSAAKYIISLALCLGRDHFGKYIGSGGWQDFYLWFQFGLLGLCSATWTPVDELLVMKLYVSPRLDSTREL